MPDEREEYIRSVRARLDQDEADEAAHRAAGNGLDDPETLPKPTIKVVSGERHLAADKAIRALVQARAPFYQRGFAIVTVAEVTAKNADGQPFQVPGIVNPTGAMLGRALAQAADWSRYDGRAKKEVAIDPPSAVVQQILAMVGEWPFAPLTGIIQCPTLRRDGSLLAEDGYDERTGLVLVNGVDIPPISSAPTREDAEAAIELLSALLDEFPFVDETSRAVALSMLLTPTLRAAMEVAPMHLVTAPLAGTGKSYLADLAAMIATGDRCAVKAASTNPEETEKRLIGAALDGHPIIALDNCRELLQGDFLCQITERPLLSLRALGKSDMHRIANTFTSFANGNNVGTAEDMVRRTLRCALDANLEHPETREFAGNPLATVRRNRGRYVAACLTIARAYIAAGRPNSLPPLVSFEGWSHTVREPLVWLGCADPVASQDTLRADDPRKIETTAVFDAWKDACGVGTNQRYTTKQIIELADDKDAFREALLAVATKRYSPERQIDPKILGKWLGAHKGTIAAKCKLAAYGSDASRPYWYLSWVQTPP
jgi:putative DNA primase/helicase